MLKNNKKNLKNSSPQLRRTTFLLGVILMFIFFIPLISSMDFDNVKSYDSIKKEITIKNAFGLPLIGSDLAKYKLTDNSNYCLINCYAEGTATLYTSGYLFSDLRFKNINNDWTSIKNNKILILKPHSYEEDILETTCEKETIVVNGTAQECSTKTKGTQTRTEYTWVEYNNEILEDGVYQWRIEGQKDKDESIDWIGTAFGNDLTEWSWWNAQWTQKKQINITGGVSNLTDFPVYLQVDFDSDMQSNYADLRFTNSSENEELYYEIDWQNSSGSGVWIKIPKLTNENEPNTTIYMYYGNPGASKTDYQDSVWGNNAVAVYHMTTNVTGNDSSIAHNNLTLDGGVWLNTTPVKGFGNQIQMPGDGATGFKGVSVKSSFGVSGNSNFTLITKFNYNSTGNNGYLFELGDDNVLEEAVFLQEIAGPQYRCAGFTGGGNFGVPNTKPHWAMVRYESGTLTCWLDGVKGLEVTPTLALKNDTINIGVNNALNSYADLVVDEFRLYNTSMSSAWLNRTLNLNDSSYYVFGDEIISPLSIEVKLDFPESGFSQLNQTFFGVANLTAVQGNIINATLYVWNSNNSLFGTTTNSTINPLTNRTNISISGLIPANSYQWNTFACATNSTDYVCSWGLTNRTFNINAYQENSNVYNATSYESLFESFEVNITTLEGNTPTSPLFYYNGTSHPASVSAISGDSFKINSSIYVPSTSTSTLYNWTFSFDVLGINQNITKNQTVNIIQFGICNSTLIVPYLNITFKNESDSNIINASVPSSTFFYYLGDITKNRTLSFTNNTENKEYSFCASPSDRNYNVDISFNYKSTSHPQRTWTPGTLALTNNTLNQTLYLLSSSDGIYVTFQVINSAEQPLSGVQVNGTRSISGTDTIVGSGTTDAAGSVTFWLNPDYSHDFSFFKSGYNQYTTTITPTQTSYTISLGGGTTTTASDYTQGISYSIKPPQGEFLFNETVYHFNYTLTSSYWTVTNFGFILRNLSGATLGSASAVTNGGIVDTSINTWNYTKIFMNYYYVVDGNYTNGSASWTVISSEDSEYGINNFFNRLRTYLAAGPIFGLERGFSLNLIIYFIIFIFVGVMSYKFGMTNPMAISLMLLALVGFFDIGLGLLTLETDVTGVLHTPVEHFPTILMFVITIGLGFREYFR